GFDAGLGNLLLDEGGGVVIIGPAIHRGEGHFDRLAILLIDAFNVELISFVFEHLLRSVHVGALGVAVGNSVSDPRIVSLGERERRVGYARVARERLVVDRCAVNRQMNRLAHSWVGLSTLSTEGIAIAGVNCQRDRRGCAYVD